jgi:hypothetical protein
MHIKIEDFETGWYGIELGLRERDIDELIGLLTELKKRKSHIHIVCSDKAPAIENIEIYWADDSDKTNSMFAGFPIEPTR